MKLTPETLLRFANTLVNADEKGLFEKVFDHWDEEAVQLQRIVEEARVLTQRPRRDPPEGR